MGKKETKNKTKLRQQTGFQGLRLKKRKSFQQQLHSLERGSADSYITKSLSMLRKLPPLGGRILISSVLLKVASLRDTGSWPYTQGTGHYSCKRLHSKDRSRGDSGSRCTTHQGNSRKHFTINSVPEIMPTDVHSLELIKPHKTASVLKRISRFQTIGDNSRFMIERKKKSPMAN